MAIRCSLMAIYFQAYFRHTNGKSYDMNGKEKEALPNLSLIVYVDVDTVEVYQQQTSQNVLNTTTVFTVSVNE